MDAPVYADDGCRLWATRRGHGEPLVLCHGGPGVWDYFEGLAGTLADAALVVRWDQRGCGRSERRGPYTVARFVADLDAVRRHVDAPRVALLGHSWGATLALRYAIEHPDRVSALVYVSGTGIDPEPTWHDAYERNLRARLGEHLPTWAALRHRVRTPDEDRALAVLQWSADFADRDNAMAHAERQATPWFGVNRECNAAVNADVRRYLNDHDVAASCRALEVPTLVVDGTDDIRPRWAVDSLCEALPRAERATLAGVGHVPWVEAPGPFYRAVSDFLWLVINDRGRSGSS
jgi:proline iminopeptidase